MRSEQQRLLARIGPAFLEMAVRIHRPSVSRGTVFCFHSFSGTGEDFVGLAGHLNQVGLTSICPDLIGRGRSAFAADAGAYTMAGYLQTVSALMQYAEKTVFFMGTGFGALLALQVVESSPGSASALALHEPLLSSSSAIAAGLPGILAAAKLRFRSQREAEAYAMARIPAGLADDVRPLIARERFRRFPDGYGFALDPNVEKPLPDGRLPDFNAESQLAKLRLPTLILGGDEMWASSANVEAASEIARSNDRVVWERTASQDGGDDSFRIVDDALSSRISGFLARYC